MKSGKAKRPDGPIASKTKAPAIHDDRIWDGPRVIDAFPGSPLVKTKTQYKALLKKHGLRMRDQQESRFGDAVTEIAPKVEAVGPPPIVVPEMSQDEAQVYGAIGALMKRHGFVETIWCDDCFERMRPHGCRMRVTASEVLLECRCGAASYRPPTGTTDLVLSTMAGAKVISNDKMAGSVMTPLGQEFRPAVLLSDMEALLVHRYMMALRRRHKEPRWFHKGCWSGDPRKEDEALGMSVSDRQIVLVCRCKQWLHQSKREVVH